MLSLSTIGLPIKIIKIYDITKAKTLCSMQHSSGMDRSNKMKSMPI